MATGVGPPDGIQPINDVQIVSAVPSADGTEVLITLKNGPVVWRPYLEIGNFTAGFFLSGGYDTGDLDTDGNPHLVPAYALSQAFRCRGRLMKNKVTYDQHVVRGRLKVVVVHATRPK